MKNILLLLAILFFSVGLHASEKKIIFYNNGNKHYEYELNQGILNGNFIGYYDNGKVKMKGRFFNNQKSGVWVFWDEKGVKRSIRKYEDNYSFELQKEWDVNGKALSTSVIAEKNASFIAARARKASERKMRYIANNWISISPEKKINQFLFDNKTFYSFLKQGLPDLTILAYEDDRFSRLVQKMLSRHIWI